MRLARSFFLSDVGLQRTTNEDAVFLSLDHQMAGIFDGMGGHDGGEIASGLALDYCEQQAPLDRPLDTLLYEIDRHISSHQPEHCLKPMGTTGLLVRWDEHTLTYAWAGDSRAYVFYHSHAPHPSTLLTEDHTVAMRRAKQGQIDKSEAKKQHDGHLLTSCLGLFGQGYEPCVVDTGTYPFRAYTTRVLLCSDGVSDLIEDSELAYLCRPAFDLDEVAETLLNTCYERGARDNLSLVLLEFVPNPS